MISDAEGNEFPCCKLHSGVYECVDFVQHLYDSGQLLVGAEIFINEEKREVKAFSETNIVVE